MINMNTLTQEQIKAMNKTNILSYICEKSPVTRQEIANKLGLSIPTVTTNVNDLVSEGIVSMDKIAQSTGGRRALMVSLIPNSRLSIGVSLEVDRIVLLLIDLNGQHLDKRKYSIKKCSDFESIIDLMCEKLELLIKENNVKKEKILGVGISLPGMVDDDKNILIHAPNLLVKDYDFNKVSEKLNLKVSIENEANIGAYAVHILGASKNIDNLVYVSITDGVGCGIIISDHIYKSNSKRAGEFGHVRISEEKLKCNCGRFGCWELYSSSNALLNLYYERSKTKLESIDELFELVEKSDFEAIDVIKKYANYLIRGLEIIAISLSPDLLIIGGPIGKYDEIMKDYISNVNNIPVQFSTLADEASLIGAAMLPLGQMLSISNVTI